MARILYNIVPLTTEPDPINFPLRKKPRKVFGLNVMFFKIIHSNVAKGCRVHLDKVEREPCGPPRANWLRRPCGFDENHNDRSKKKSRSTIHEQRRRGLAIKEGGDEGCTS